MKNDTKKGGRRPKAAAPPFLGAAEGRPFIFHILFILFILYSYIFHIFHIIIIFVSYFARTTILPSYFFHIIFIVLMIVGFIYFSFIFHILIVFLKTTLCGFVVFIILLAHCCGHLLCHGAGIHPYLGG